MESESVPDPVPDPGSVSDDGPAVTGDSGRISVRSFSGTNPSMLCVSPLQNPSPKTLKKPPFFAMSETFVPAFILHVFFSAALMMMLVSRVIVASKATPPSPKRGTNADLGSARPPGTSPKSGKDGF